MKTQTSSNKEEKIKYTGKCIKMDDRTWELFKKKRKQSGLSWNRYIYSLLNKEK